MRALVNNHNVSPGGTVNNAAGGYYFPISSQDRLIRFLTLGTEGGTYYTSERELTKSNVDALEATHDTLDTIVDVSVGGKASKNDYCLYALAYCTVHGDDSVRKRAFSLVTRVARTASHLYMFVSFREMLGGGWGRGMRSCMADWYNSRDARNLAYQVTKYRQRYGWSSGDILRLSHPVTSSEEHRLIYDYLVGGTDYETSSEGGISEYLRAASMTTVTPSAIRAYKLPREVIPTNNLKQPEIWDALLDDMPIGALVRNLYNLHKHGVLSRRRVDIADKLSDETAIVKSRLHPVSILKGWLSLDIAPSIIVDALEDAFEHSFQNVETTGKRVLYAVDTSGSMNYIHKDSGICGIRGMSPKKMANVMCMLSARTETDYNVIGFDNRVRPHGISKRSSLSEAIRAGINRGYGTNASLPFTWASQNGMRDIDAFVLLTDNEHWVGNMHPYNALQNYRRFSGKGDVKLVTVSMTANEGALGDPDDKYVFDVVGMSTDTPRLINNFIASS